MRKIAFIGFTNSIDFNHIGGASAVIRRIAFELAKVGDQVDFVQYGTDENSDHDVFPNIRQINFKTFAGLRDHIKNGYDHVIAVYLKPIDRISFVRFRRAHRRRIIFHQLFLAWSENPIRRRLFFADARASQPNGSLLCVSPRIYRHVSTWSDRAVLMLPSVEEQYFLKPCEKTRGDKLRIVYLGRVDPRKGTMTAVDIFHGLAPVSHIESRICGFSWARLPETARLEKKLQADPSITYESVKPDEWTAEVDRDLRTLLHNTDVVLLPYQKLSSTIDVPLLLLEAMASLCAVVTKPFGDIPDIYGPSNFTINHKNFVQDAISFLTDLSFDDLTKEQERIYGVNERLDFTTGTVTKTFISAMEEWERR